MRGATLLFLDKCLLIRRGPVLRGVELFNLGLLADLTTRELVLTVPAHRSWHALLAGRLPGVRLIPVPGLPWPLLSALWLIWGLRRQRHQVLLIGNCARDLIPTVWWLARGGVAGRRLLMVHRWPSRRVLRAWRHSLDGVVAVNGIIAGQFRQHGYRRVDHYFGETRAARFFPAERGEAPTVSFCVLGALHTAVKAPETAVAAFQQLPGALRARCRLHLVGYHGTLPAFGPGILSHRWQDEAAVPALLREMDVLVVPSRQETFSLAMVQGMLSGLPVLARDIPGLAEKRDEGGGWVFADEAELAEQMARLAGDPALRRRLGATARRTALARYCWDTDVFLRRFVFSP